MDDLRHARSVIELAARELDAAALDGQGAIDGLTELGMIRRITDGMVGKMTKRVEDTAAYTYGSDRNAAEVCARLVGVGTGEAKRAMEVASQLQSLRSTIRRSRES